MENKENTFSTPKINMYNAAYLLVKVGEKLKIVILHFKWYYGVQYTRLTNQTNL